MAEDTEETTTEENGVVFPPPFSPNSEKKHYIYDLMFCTNF